MHAITGMRVIGTAGHVDHGKSTLVRRLTGIDPDRLVEEKTREMTIDLGFAWLTLPSGIMTGIVDVPGHRDFIDNMLAGVGGIDAVILVIAADEGVMPQTREHLAILDLLTIKNGVIVLTKTDMVDDPGWINLIQQDVRDIISGTGLEHAPILPVSAMTGAGLDDLIQQIDTLLASIPERSDYLQPRLPVDRVFTMGGFGTVVTGTLMGGSLRTGDDIELQPTGLRGRIRGLQCYQQSVDTAYPGSRVAVNITGIEKKAVARGHVLSFPGQVHPTSLVDVYFRHLPDANRALKHNAEVKIYCGTAETRARIRLLDHDPLLPGAEGWLQLRLSHPLPLSSGDRFILRYSSPSETIGGGIVMDANPGRRWKRFQPEVIARLEILMKGSPVQRVVQAAESAEPVTISELQKRSGYDLNMLRAVLDQALAEGRLIKVSDDAFLATSSFTAHLHRMTQILTFFHHQEPLRPGMPREALRSQMGIKNITLNFLISQHQEIITQGGLLRMTDHEIRFNAKQQASIQQLVEQMNAAPYTPPSYMEACNLVGENVLRALIELEEIIQVQADVILARAVYQDMVNGALAIIDATGSIDAKSLRDRYNTSRKYAIALLEHLDTVGITRRVGDSRVRGPY